MLRIIFCIENDLLMKGRNCGSNNANKLFTNQITGKPTGSIH